VSRSALVSHFEAGTCPSGLTREQLNRIVTRMDRNNVITNPARLIKGPDGYAPATVTKTWATDRSWNGDAYECFLCNKTFNTLHALNAHLQSPRHQEKIYRCPNRTSCGMEFQVLSSLTQHVESGKCGVNRFKDVQNALDSLVSGVRRLTV
jgi:Zinc-finger of C2H2 type